LKKAMMFRSDGIVARELLQIDTPWLNDIARLRSLHSLATAYLHPDDQHLRSSPLSNAAFVQQVLLELKLL
jgi:hypothetical protein